MRHLTTSVFASALITVCLQFAPASSQTKPANKTVTGTGTVSGRVTVKGKGMPGIVVGLHKVESRQRSRSTLKGTTDEDGKYRIANVPAGAYQVAPLAPLFVFFDVGRTGTPGKDLLIAEGEAVEGFDFAMVRGGVITGKVTDTEGRPVVEEFMQLEWEDQTGRNSFSSEGVQTDDRGIYRAFGLAPGNYRVSAGLGDDGFSGDGRRAIYRRTYYPDTTDRTQAKVVEVAEASEATNIDITVIRMARGFSASGRVVDGKSGEPVGNVQIYFTKIIVEGNSTHHSGGPVLRTNTKGEFRSDGLTPGKYTVSLSQERGTLRTEHLTFDVLDQDVTGLLIKTSIGASLNGTVVMEASTQAAGLKKPLKMFVSAFLRDVAPHGGSGWYSEVKSDGSFQITGLPAGSVQLMPAGVDESGGRPNIVVLRIERDGVVQPDGIDVQDGEQVTGVRLVVTQGTGTVRGTIKIENGPIPADARLFVSLVKPGDASGTPSPIVDARGHFEATQLTSGTYEIQAHIYMPRSNQSFPSAKQTVSVTDGVATEVTITVDAQQISRPVP